MAVEQHDLREYFVNLDLMAKLTKTYFVDAVRPRRETKTSPGLSDVVSIILKYIDDILRADESVARRYIVSRRLCEHRRYDAAETLFGWSFLTVSNVVIWNFYSTHINMFILF
jgi:uncharacterized protein YerC